LNSPFIESGINMARETTKMPIVGPAVPEPAPELFTQRGKVEIGRYRLLVDRQLKASYQAPEAAEVVGLAIKRSHPIVQVAIYDVTDGTTHAIEISAT
jgi:hypothetical protein